MNDCVVAHERHKPKERKYNDEQHDVDRPQDLFEPSPGLGGPNCFLQGRDDCRCRQFAIGEPFVWSYDPVRSEQLVHIVVVVADELWAASPSDSVPQPANQAA